MNDLVWVGDDIGLGNGDATIQIRDAAMPKGRWYVDLAAALQVGSRIDRYGLWRMESALVHAFEHGHLSAADADTWREYVSTTVLQPRPPIVEINGAAHAN